MTRFARAKGSKASNERQPNEPTPWHVMKGDMKKDHSTKISEKPKSVSELLKVKDKPFYCDDIGNVNHGWSEFENTQAEKKANEKTKKQKKKSENMVKKKIEETQKSDKGDHVNDNNTTKLENESDMKNTISTGNEKIIKTKKAASKNIEPQQVKTEESTVPLSKRQKRNKKAKKDTTDKTITNEEESTAANTNFNIEGNNWNTNVKFGKKRKLREEINKKDNSKKQDNNMDTESKEKAFVHSNPNNNAQQATKRKAPKVRDNNIHKRRKPDIGGTTITVNGQDIDIVKYDGFPIMKEDAERIKELKKEMVNKGIPYSEINRALKLERRRCEKALARRKKNVCFHCRKSGHNLSECPDLDKEESATGICFKCGSTEHTHFECKVNKTQEFRHATCFICREQGHIAKQCPDNPKGLYPQGGACKICGDVTHLKKDCPDLMKEKEENTITVDTIASEGIESLDKDSSNVAKDLKTGNNTAKKKVINF